MRLLINAVAARMGGAATHLPNFLRTAGRRYPDDTFIACVNTRWEPPALPPNVRLIRPGEFRGRVIHAAWDLWGVPRLAARERADVLVSLLNFGPVRCRVPQVVFERNPVYFCEDYLRGLSRPRAAEVTATRAFAHAVMRSARRIITPSAAMREMIRRFCPDLAPERFRVIPHGFGHAEFRAGAPLPPQAAGAVAGSSAARLLYVSHAASYKGIEILLEAARLLEAAGTSCTTWLTIAPEDWPAGVAQHRAFIARHGLGDRVRLLGRVPHEAVPRLYASADVFVYPSLCESFGFPLVEAMASGLPIVAADRPVNREMCGEAAVYYPARDPAALAREITRLHGDEARRMRLAAAGRIRAQEFSWQRHVDEVMAVTREAAQEGVAVRAEERDH